MVADAPHGRDRPRGAGRADGRPQGAAASRQGAAAAGRGAAAGRAPQPGRRARRTRCSTMSSLSCGPARSSASPASRATARPSCWRCWRASAAPTGGRLTVCGRRDRCPAIPAIRPRCATSAWRMCRRIACARAWWRRSRRRRPRSWAITSRRRSAGNYLLDGPAVGRTLRRPDGALRRAAARARPALVELLRRQPAEARAGARDGARAQGAAGRPADARRRYRRHRIHPSRAGEGARRRAAPCWWSRSSSTRSSRSPTASW